MAAPPSSKPPFPPLPPPPSSPQLAYERAFRGWAAPMSDLVDLAEDRSSGRLSYHVFTAADLPAYRAPVTERPKPKASVLGVALGSLAVSLVVFTGALVMVASDDAAPARAHMARAAAVAAMPAAMELPPPVSEPVPGPVLELDAVVPDAPARVAEVAPKPVKAKPRILVPKNPYE